MSSQSTRVFALGGKLGKLGTTTYYCEPTHPNPLFRPLSPHNDDRIPVPIVHLTPGNNTSSLPHVSKTWATLPKVLLFILILLILLIMRLLRDLPAQALPFIFFPRGRGRSSWG